MQVRAGKEGVVGTLGLTATPPQTERGQRNEAGLGPFHERISRASVMLRSGGDNVDRFLILAIYVLLLLICSGLHLCELPTGSSRATKNLGDR